MNVAQRSQRLSAANHSPSRNDKSAARPPHAKSELARRIGLLVNAACAARVGAAHMTLDDWREVEQEVERKLLNERSKSSPDLGSARNVPATGGRFNHEY